MTHLSLLSVLPSPQLLERDVLLRVAVVLPLRPLTTLPTLVQSREAVVGVPPSTTRRAKRPDDSASPRLLMMALSSAPSCGVPLLALLLRGVGDSGAEGDHSWDARHLCYLGVSSRALSRPWVVCTTLCCVLYSTTRQPKQNYIPSKVSYHTSTGFIFKKKGLYKYLRIKANFTSE